MDSKAGMIVACFLRLGGTGEASESTSRRLSLAVGDVWPLLASSTAVGLPSGVDL